MIYYAFDKYFKNFKHIIIYILAYGIFNFITLRLVFIDLSFTELFITTNRGYSSAYGGYTSVIPRVIIYLIMILFTTPIFSCYIRLIVKKVINEENINHMEAFKEGLHYYWRYIGINIIIALMIIGIAIGMAVLLLIPVLGILLFIVGIIFLVYISTIYNICTEYLIYNDCSLEEALSEGKRIGKNRFWSIFFLGFCINIISKILEKISEQGAVISIIITFVVLGVSVFSIVFLMALCKEDKNLFLM